MARAAPLWCADDGICPLIIREGLPAQRRPGKPTDERVAEGAAAVAATVVAVYQALCRLDIGVCEPTVGEVNLARLGEVMQQGLRRREIWLYRQVTRAARRCKQPSIPWPLACECAACRLRSSGPLQLALGRRA